MELEEVLKKYKKPKKTMPLVKILRVFIREGIENFYICRKEDIDVLIEGVERLQKENEELKNIDLITVHIKGVCDEKERWRNKIREKINNIKSTIELSGGRSSGKLAKHYKNFGRIEALEDLLKEE